MDVARSFPMAPRTNASRGVILLERRRRVRMSFNRSKMVYCKIGFMTRMRAGRTPAKREVGPSSLSNLINVERVEGFLSAGFSE